MDFPVSSSIEQSVSKQVNALVGNNDVNLNTIVKMSVLNENGGNIDNDLQKEVLAKIKQNNKMEHFWIEKDYELTMDSNGNIIPVNINGETEGNTTSVLSESKGSQEKTE